MGWVVKLLNILAVVACDRKYFGSGCSSRMSDNVDPLPVLGYSVILAVKHLPLAVIPQFIKRPEDGFKCDSAVALIRLLLLRCLAIQLTPGLRAIAKKNATSIHTIGRAKL